MHSDSNALATTLPVLAPAGPDLETRNIQKWDTITANYLVHQTREYAKAINSRSFELDAAPWTTLDPNFKFDSWQAGKSAMIGSHEWVAMLKRTAEMNPDYHIQILDMSTTLGPDRKQAEVFMNVKTSGLPCGVVRQKVTVLKWKLTSEATSTGGVNWVDIVSAEASRCGTTTYNYAVGANMVNASRAHVAGGFKVGGPIKDLRDQEKEFAKNDVLWVSENTIFIHWFGINDVAIQVWSGRNLNDSEAILRPDIDDYFGLFERQHSLGARSFVTILMPPIHRAPIFNYGFSPEAREVQSLTEYWNDYMQEERKKFLLHYPNTTSIVFDPSPAFNRILDDPHNYGLPQRKAKHGAASLWHDFIHLGIDIQKAVGEEVNNVLQKSWPCGETEDIR
ncbi:hypothetical protein PRZ48_013994 [Zasmidium cellare]|uniref:SGNH hydrolase-type esterase domain-containing protein n=1 Tax=Zasmidium cellare TaxID=395010 RepID=A0ABR0E0F5_ZASCE|nr:hypothetical protein PRZ48_013994 [Zasmidium cellare]